MMRGIVIDWWQTAGSSITQKVNCLCTHMTFVEISK